MTTQAISSIDAKAWASNASKIDALLSSSSFRTAARVWFGVRRRITCGGLPQPAMNPESRAAKMEPTFSTGFRQATASLHFE